MPKQTSKQSLFHTGYSDGLLGKAASKEFKGSPPHQQAYMKGYREGKAAPRYEKEAFRKKMEKKGLGMSIVKAALERLTAKETASNQYGVFEAAINIIEKKLFCDNCEVVDYDPAKRAGGRATIKLLLGKNMTISFDDLISAGTQLESDGYYATMKCSPKGIELTIVNDDS